MTLIILYIITSITEATTTVSISTVSISTSNTNPPTNTGFEKTATTSTTINKQCICQCRVTAITTGVTSVIITALIVAGTSFAIQISIYQCFYKPRLRSISVTTVTVTGGDHSQREGVTGSGDTIVYERVGTTLEMKENEAYSVNKRVGGLEMKQNEAYGVTRSA